MQKNNVFVSDAEMAKQNEYKEKVHTVLGARFGEKTPMAFVHTYGCQGNVADSEHIKGMLVEMG